MTRTLMNVTSSKDSPGIQEWVLGKKFQRNSKLDLEKYPRELTSAFSIENTATEYEMFLNFFSTEAAAVNTRLALIPI